MTNQEGIKKCDMMLKRGITVFGENPFNMSFARGTHELSQYLFEQLLQLLSTTKIGCSPIRIMTPVFNMSRQIFEIMCRHIEIPLRRSLAVIKTLPLRL